MSPPSRNDLKKALVAAGYEVYRTLPERIILADRVRENLIMDSGVSVTPVELTVRVVTRAQRSDFPQESPESLLARARGMAQALVARGYIEIATEEHRLLDPSDTSHTLDVWYEVTYQREVGSLDAVLGELSSVIALEKVAAPTRLP